MKNERILVFKHLFDPKEFEVREMHGIGYSVIVDDLFLGGSHCPE
jgi:hypothetical protein